jgi:predicted metalloprotease
MRASLPSSAMLRPRFGLALLLTVAATLGTVGCGQTDPETVRDQVRAEVQRRTQNIKGEVRRRRERIRKRIEEVLGQIEQAIPEAQTTSPRVRSRGRTGTETIDRFLSDILASVDAYWTKTLTASNLPAPNVRYDWIAPGHRAITGCNAVADDSAAFYCPNDDTIYFAQQFAAELYQGVARGLPGQSAGAGRAAGDFGVAYVVAHEYAHNIQNELGLFKSGPRSRSAKPFELQADCMAGTWGNSVYEQGLLKPGDIEEAMNTALAVGDFDVNNEQHHGTPEERRSAWLSGFRGGDPSVCRQFVPGS